MARPLPLWKVLKNRGLNVANDLLIHFQVSKPPVPVEAIIEALGVSLHRVPGPGWSGAVNVLNGDHAIIWIDMADPPERQRFTMAHELGHLMRHDTAKAFRDVTFDGSPQESEANRYAADLLMPHWMVDDYADKVITEEDLQKLSELFGVSKVAMHRGWLEALGLPVSPL